MVLNIRTRMIYTTLISTQELFDQLTNPNWVIIDCRFSLDDTERGRRDYQKSHIPGALYAHLDKDLSGSVIPGKTGRHPLPDIETFSQTLSNWGVGPSIQVVAYDDKNGSIAARLWWLLRWLGHDAIAVLNGGWARWQSENRSIRSDVETPTPRQFTPYPRPELVVSSSEVETMHNNPSFRIVDSRNPERYWGDIEPIDPVAGHIPGAVNVPFVENLNPEGLFLPLEDLRTRFQKILGDIPVKNTIFYCGSGVTAAHNILALSHAGLGDARLYAGSWSEWITNQSRPVERRS